MRAAGSCASARVYWALPGSPVTQKGAFAHLCTRPRRLLVKTRVAPVCWCVSAPCQCLLPWAFPVAWVVLGALAVLLMGLRAFAWDPLPLADVAWAWMLVPAGPLVLSLVCCSCFGGRGRVTARLFLALVAPVATSALLLALGLGGQIHINVRRTVSTPAACTLSLT